MLTMAPPVGMTPHPHSRHSGPKGSTPNAPIPTGATGVTILCSNTTGTLITDKLTVDRPTICLTVLSPLMSYTPCCLVVLVLKTNVAALSGPSAARSHINLLNFKSLFNLQGFGYVYTRSYNILCNMSRP
jgi:hypothetical protein